jgi:hypothetical protein
MILNVSSPQPAHPNLLPGGATRRGLCLSAVVCPGRAPGRAPLRGLCLARVVCPGRAPGRVPLRGLCLAGVVCPGQAPGRVPLWGLFLAGVGCRSRGPVVLQSLSPAVLGNLATGGPTGRPGVGRGGAVGWRSASWPSLAGWPRRRRR